MSDIIHITYCSKEKNIMKADDSKLFLPSELYTSSRVQNFIEYCKKNKYLWAIFSDYYGIVFEDETIEWYDKSPDLVTDKDYECLMLSTLQKLQQYNQVVFYYKNETFHQIYKRFVVDLQKSKTVVLINKLKNND